MFFHSGNARFPVPLALATVVALMAGCAGTAPKPKFAHTLVAESRVSAPDSADVLVDTADGISMIQEERDRVAQKIKAKIDERKARNPAAASARTLQVAVHITRYEKGNSFARFMLAGLGQIHLDGTISVYQMPEHVLLGDFDLQKTFAWGGIYGGSTGMEDIENTYADAVAATVTGQQEADSSSKTGAGADKTKK